MVSLSSRDFVDEDTSISRIALLDCCKANRSRLSDGSSGTAGCFPSINFRCNAPIPATAWRIAGYTWVAWRSCRCQNAHSVNPASSPDDNVQKKWMLSRSSAEPSWETGSMGVTGKRRVAGMIWFGSEAGARWYPSHFRPVDVHRLQCGFASSHFTLLIL